MKKRFGLVILILVIIFGGTFAWYRVRVSFTKSYIAHFKAPAVAVSTQVAAKKTWNPMLKAVGTLTAINSINVSSEVNGQVIQLYFKSGQLVKKGDPLIQLEAAVYQQTLYNHIAQLNLDQITYERQVTLYKTRSTSKSAVDAAQAKMLKSRAQVKTAQVMLARKKIKAPFDGRLGIRQVNIGQYVTPGVALVPLQSLNPLLVDFALPEQDLRLLSNGQKIKIKTDAYVGELFKGKITAINSKVNVITRSISVRATIPNNDGRLYPGLFADVSVILPQKQNVITIPQTAITYSLHGDSVFVVTKSKDKKGKTILIATQKFVTVGDRRGIVIAIKKGVKAGDVVVTSGQLKLHSGAHIIVNNTVKLN